MSKKKILMTSPWPKYAEKAKEEGFYLIALWDSSGDAEALNKVHPFADEVYVIDYNDEKKVESLIDWIYVNVKFDYMYHLGKDEHMEMAYRIACKYNMNLNSLETISIMNDKYKMRNFLKERNLSPIHYKWTDIINVDSDIGEFPFPFIIKPTSLSGSRGVLLCKDMEDLAVWKESMSKYNYSGLYLIEEYLEGKEVSIETLSYQGKHFIVGVTDKIKTDPPLFVELGHIFPSNLEENEKNDITKLVIDILTALDYQFGPVHTEVIITKNGPKIVELQPRLAGDRIPLLIKEATGISVEKTIFKMLKGEHPKLGGNKLISTIHFFKWKTGKVKEIKGIESIVNFPSVKMLEISIKPEMFIESIYDSASRSGYVVVSGSSYNQIKEEIQKVEDTLSITYYD